jgi:hypothetical protein
MPVDVIKPGTLEGRCGTCARFVRVRETVDQNGEVKRAGDCLLGVWPSPLYETSTCPQYIKRGTVGERRPAIRRAPRAPRPARAMSDPRPPSPVAFELPEEILDMDAEEFREVLRDVIREELGVAEVELGGRWQGGEVVLKPGKEGTQEKRLPIEALFRKIVAVRDKLRLLEQKINGHPRLTEEDKVQMQQYITQSYGSLTTFNVLFAERTDAFVGQKGDKED